MSLLTRLIEIQELDLAADAARRRSEERSERQSLPAVEAEITRTEAALATTCTEQTAQEPLEAELGKQVAQVAREIAAAEVARYSGGHLDREEAQAHDDAQALLRERQTTLEQREMELLEILESLENRVGELQSTLSAKRAETAQLEEAIAKVEHEVVVELNALAGSRLELVQDLPPEVLSAYEHARGQPRSGGRGAAVLEAGSCRGCHIKLPSVERTRMLAEPEDALLRCPQCRRVLIR